MIKSILKWLRKWRPVSNNTYEKVNNITGRLTTMEEKSENRYSKLSSRLDKMSGDNAEMYKAMIEFMKKK